MKTIISGENVMLVESVFKDCDYFATWEKQPYVMEYFTMEKGRDYEEIVTEFVLFKHDDSKFQFTILLKQSQKPIGRVYLSRYDRFLNSLDITRIYIGEKDYLGLGYGCEAMKLLLRFLFEELKLERATLDFYEDNIKAKKLYEGLAFKSEGILRHATKKNGIYMDLHSMSLLKDEYFSLKGKQNF